MVQASTYVDAMEKRRGFAQFQLEQLGQQRQEYADDVERLEQLLDRTRKELVGYLLPELDDAALTTLQERLEYPGLLPIKREHERKLAEAEAQLAQLSAEDEIANYELRLGQIDDQIAEIADAHESLRSELYAWNGSRWLEELKKRGYFRDGYTPWLIDRFRDWRAVSFLMADLVKAKVHDFSRPGPLREHYRKLRSEAEPVIALRADLDAQRKRLQERKAAHDELAAAPQRLLAALYQALGAALLDHLAACPDELRVRLAANDPYLRTFLRKERGVDKKVQYLRELTVARIDALSQQLDQEQQKLGRKINKLNSKIQRGRARSFNEEDLERMGRLKQDKWERRQDKLRRLRTRITSFDRYERGSYRSDYLWWDLMTNRARGDDIYEVRTFRERHPDWDYQAHVDLDGDAPHDDDGALDDAAVALAYTMQDAEGDEGLLGDPS